MAELLADLLLDHDLIDAQVELLLPLAGIHWRVVDGIEPQPEVQRHGLDPCDEPL